MTKARILADFISDGSSLADGTISVAEVSGAAPLASPTFTGTVVATSLDISGDIDVDGTTNLDVVDIDGAVDMASTLLVTGVLTTTAATVFNGGFASNAASTIATTDNSVNLTLTSTDADASGGPKMNFYRNSASPAAGDILTQIGHQGKNDAGETVSYMYQNWRAAAVGDGAESGQFDINTYTAGTAYERMGIDPTETVFNNDSADLDFRVESDGNTHALFVDASVDRVGVGAAPMTNGSTFQVTSDSTEANNMQLTLRGASDTNKQMVMGFDTTANTAHVTTQIAGSAPTPLIFKTGNVVFNEASSDSDFRVESDANANAFFVDAASGNVCFGAGAASGATNMGYFHILSNNCHLNVSNTQTSNITACYYANRQSSDGTAIFFQRGGTNVGSIGVNSSSTSFNTSSDYRLKENVVYDWDATTRLKQLKPARFNFIADADTTVDGFLAHEAQAVVPECATGTHNEVDDDGAAVMQGIDQSKLVPLLVKTIQELEARITALENA
jgi:hypothetical protein